MFLTFVETVWFKGTHTRTQMQYTFLEVNTNVNNASFKLLMKKKKKKKVCKCFMRRVMDSTRVSDRKTTQSDFFSE